MPSLEHLRQNEPVFNWCFRLTFEPITGITEFLSTSGLPKDSVNVVLVQYKNYHKAIAGRETHQQLTFSVKGYVDPNTAVIMWNWFKKVYHSNVVGAPKDYKHSGNLSLTNGRGDNIANWQLIGCWPSTMDIGQGDYSNSELVQITATIEVDDMELSS